MAKLPFQHAHDGISYTFGGLSGSLGRGNKRTWWAKDGYFTADGGQHLNVNVFDMTLLLDAMAHLELSAADNPRIGLCGELCRS